MVKSNPTRRTAREWAIQMLTAADLNPPDDVAAFVDSYFTQISDLEIEDGGPSFGQGKLREFARERVSGVLKDQPELDAALTAHLDNWDLYRLGTVERAVLRLGAWEILHTDIPKAVAINEAIDLVNWFSSAKSKTLVNGVLDRLGKASTRAR